MMQPKDVPLSHDAPTSLNLSVDDAKKHLKFLQGLHALGVTTISISSKMMDRYINKWLPLMAHHQKEATDTKMPTSMMMIPPPDVAWLWHCHRLAPKHYEAYTVLHFGFVVEPCPSFLYQLDDDSAKQSNKAGMEMVSFNQAEAAEFTKYQWSQMFLNDPFFSSPEDAEECLYLKDTHVNKVRFDEEFVVNWSNKLDGYDLIASAACQASFLWQVSGPRFSDDDFLKEGINEYYKFLLLKDDGKLLPLVPTYQIDLMWHTHILINCRQYIEDCTCIRGGPLHHDDSLNDRTPGAKLDQAFVATSNLWKKTYGTEYYAVGGMYRGEPPTAFYDAASWNLMAGTDAGDRMAIIPLTSAPSPPSTSTTRHGILVGGSSSAGSNVVDASPWANPSSADLFIAAASKSKTSGVNSNPFKDEYVFGTGTSGLGYYSPQTLDAWKILRTRLVRKARLAKSDVDWFDCQNCLCFCSPSRSQVQRKEILIKRWVELEWQIAFVAAKCECAGPSVTTSPSEIDKHHRARHGNNPDELLLSGSICVWYSTSVCVAAGGCGGGGGTGGRSGGGCGGGGCGAAACGGGGCGGGGCGGGCGG